MNFPAHSGENASPRALLGIVAGAKLRRSVIPFGSAVPSASVFALMDELVERADDLLQRATALRRRCQLMSERLQQLARDVPGAGAPPDPHEGIRVVATNLALSGADRDEVDSRLREAFGAVDSAPILDEVFAAASKTSGPARQANGRFARRQ
jgi:hypothetical protein